MAKITRDVCDARCHLFHNEIIRKENAIRRTWFLKNQERLIDQLKEPKFTKRAREIIAESKKREAVRVDRPIVCNFTHNPFNSQYLSLLNFVRT